MSRFISYMCAGLLFLALLSSPSTARAQTWQPLEKGTPFNASTALLLTDGTVMCQEFGGSAWWRLTPDENGSYVKGHWSQLASLPAGFAPLYYASAVLADGRVVVIGGEYNFFVASWINLGAIYNSTTDTWSPLAAPSGWDNIGDAQATVLPNGKFLLAQPSDTRIAQLDPRTLTWTELGTGKADRNDEEGWTLLPDGTVLTVDAENAPRAEKYIPWKRQWIDAGSTGVLLTDASSDEIGPAVLRPDGTVFALGATGHNSVYFPPANPLQPGRWKPAPDFPFVPGEGQLTVADGPAALLPNGNVLAAASPGVFNASTHFFEFNGSQLTEVAATPRAPYFSSFEGRMLLLPTGQVMFTDGSPDVQIYSPKGKADPAWAPKIIVCRDRLKPGGSYRIWGKQFNGLSQAVAYGDDATAATNYPLVRIKNVASGHVRYCRTHDHSTMGVATGHQIVFTHFDVPADTETGRSEIVVVANGIESNARHVDIGRSYRECDDEHDLSDQGEIEER